MLTRPFCIIPQPDEGTVGPGSTGCLSPGDCPGMGIQSGVPGASAPFSISPDASFPTCAPGDLFERKDRLGLYLLTGDPGGANSKLPGSAARPACANSIEDERFADGR